MNITTAETYHVPVLLKESVDGLGILPDGIYVDVTFGGGGHSKEILSRLGKKGHLYSFDQDADAEQNIVADDRFTFVRSNFRYVSNWMAYYGVEKIDGLLADLGVSSHHFDDAERGFSFRFDSPLDMRMNRSSSRDARAVLAESSEEHLADVFYLYGELKQARRMAAAVVRARAAGDIATTGRLVEVLRPMIRPAQEKKELAQVFQALRIEVNDEMEVLKRLLGQAVSLLNPGGRLVVITYHSLEDRLVKNFMRTGNIEGRQDKDFFGRVHTPFKVVNNKVIVPDAAEVARNPRSRSAKLRIAERLAPEQ